MLWKQSPNTKQCLLESELTEKLFFYFNPCDTILPVLLQDERSRLLAPWDISIEYRDEECFQQIWPLQTHICPVAPLQWSCVKLLKPFKKCFLTCLPSNIRNNHHFSASHLTSSLHYQIIFNNRTQWQVSASTQCHNSFSQLPRSHLLSSKTLTTLSTRVARCLQTLLN